MALMFSFGSRDTLMCGPKSLGGYFRPITINLDQSSCSLKHPAERFFKKADELVGFKQRKVCGLRLPLCEISCIGATDVSVAAAVRDPSQHGLAGRHVRGTKSLVCRPSGISIFIGMHVKLIWSRPDALPANERDL